MYLTHLISKTKATLLILSIFLSINLFGQDKSKENSRPSNILFNSIHNTQAINLKKGDALNVTSGGILTVGEPSKLKTYQIPEDIALNINGTLKIWGNLHFANKAKLFINGTLEVHGNLIMGDDGEIEIPGSVMVEKNMFTNNYVSFKVDGKLNVGGELDIAHETVAFGNGTVVTGYTGNTYSAKDSFENAPPLEFTHFGLHWGGGKINFFWNTPKEIANSYFIIEASPNRMTWKPVGKLKDKGNSFSSDGYKMTLKTRKLKKSHYLRLKQISTEGKIEVFPTVKLEKRSGFMLYTFPNQLVKNHLKRSRKHMKVGYELRDINGNVLQSGQWHSEKSVIYKTVDLTYNAYGTYSFRTVDLNTGRHLQTKVIKE